MKNSEFEDLLRKKAMEFKPPVSASVLSGIKAATSMSYAYSAKVIVINLIHSLALKAVIGVAILGSVTYLAINKTSQETTSQSPISSEITQNNAHSNLLIASKNNKTTAEKTLKITPINQAESNSINESYNKQDIHKKESASDYKNNNLEHSNVPHPNIFSAQNKTSNFQLIHSKSISNLPYFNTLDQQELLIMDSIDIELFNKQHTVTTKDVLNEDKHFPTKIFISIETLAAKSFLLNNQTDSNNNEEKQDGLMFGGNLALSYGLNEHWRVGLKGSYQNINIKSKFYSNNDQDGVINRDLTLAVLKAGFQYRHVFKQKWTYSLTAYAGLASKLKHETHFSGKLLDNPFSLDLKNKDKWSPALDFSFDMNYDFTKNLSLNMGLFSDYIQFNENFKILNTGVKLGITYNL